MADEEEAPAEEATPAEEPPPAEEAPPAGEPPPAEEAPPAGEPPAEAPAEAAAEAAAPEEKKEAKAEGEVLTEGTIKKLGENRQKIQELNNTIRDLRCQDLFAKNRKMSQSLTDELMIKMKMANCDFLRNINNMWGMTQNLLEGLDLERIVSGELSYVPSSTVGIHTKVTRSESFEKLSSKKLPRVIVCGTDTAEMVPRIIVCEDRNTTVPPGDCNMIQSNKNVASSSMMCPSNYTSYGGRYC